MHYGGIEVVMLTIPRETYTYQVKRHRKSRIDKKWAKRYGFRTVVDRNKGNEILKIGDKAYCYPHVYENLMAAIRDINDRLNHQMLSAPPPATWPGGLAYTPPEPPRIKPIFPRYITRFPERSIVDIRMMS